MQTRSQNKGLVKPLLHARQSMAQALSEASDSVKDTSTEGHSDEANAKIKASLGTLGENFSRLKALEESQIKPPPKVCKAAQKSVDEFVRCVRGHLEDEALCGLLNRKQRQRLTGWMELKRHWFEEGGGFKPFGKNAPSTTPSDSKSGDAPPSKIVAELMSVVQALSDEVRGLKDKLNEKASQFDYLTDAYRFVRGPSAPLSELPHPMDLSNPGVALSALLAIAYLRRKAITLDMLDSGLSEKMILSETGQQLEAAIVECMSPKEARPVSEATKKKVKEYTVELLELYRHWLRERDVMPMVELTRIYDENYRRLKSMAQELTVDLVSRLTNKDAASALARTLLLDPSRLPPELRDIAKEWQSKVSRGGWNGNGNSKRDRDGDDEKEESESAAAGKGSKKKKYRERQKNQREELKQLLAAVDARGLKWKNGKLN